MPPKILISACLLGQPVRYDGKGKPLFHPLIDEWKGEGRLLWTPPDWWKHPLQARIISTLASLPVRKMAGGAMFKGVARLNVGDSRRLP